MKKLFWMVGLTFVCRITLAQNVGIGTSAPVERLHVAGNIKLDTLKPNGIKLTSGAGEGKVLTSDLLGNASWQSRTETNANGTVGFGTWGDCSLNGISEYNPVTDTIATPVGGIGTTVAISGKFAIAGCVLGESVSTTPGFLNVYQFNGANWEFMQRLTNPDGGNRGGFSQSIAISGNFIFVGVADDIGAPGTFQGSVCVFHYDGNEWKFFQRLTDPNGLPRDAFGFSVSISGNNAIVGARAADGAQADQGAAFVYHFNGTSWELSQKLTDPTGATGDVFGQSVSISGNFAVVGEAGDDVDTKTNQGSACFFQFNGNSWLLLNKITDAAGLANDVFGISVTASGNFAAISSRHDNSLIGAASGTVFIYRFDGTNWIFTQKLLSSATGINWGRTLAMSGDYLFLGNPRLNTGAKGFCSIYSRIGQRWEILQDGIVDPQNGGASTFGNAVGIDGMTHRFIIGDGAYGDNFSGKVVFGKF